MTEENGNGLSAVELEEVGATEETTIETRLALMEAALKELAQLTIIMWTQLGGAVTTQGQLNDDARGN